MITALAFAAAIAAGPVHGDARPCQTEDASARADRHGCVWDARHAGNGTGKSFVVHRDGSVTYVTHRRAHNLLTAS